VFEPPGSGSNMKNNLKTPGEATSMAAETWGYGIPTLACQIEPDEPNIHQDEPSPWYKIGPQNFRQVLECHVLEYHFQL
jgi:hypothetical protein